MTRAYPPLDMVNFTKRFCSMVKRFNPNLIGGGAGSLKDPFYICFVLFFFIKNYTKLIFPQTLEHYAKMPLV